MSFHKGDAHSGFLVEHVLFRWNHLTSYACCVILQVCKYFLDAIENNKYGWFWVCPGGGDNCMYRHALPPGFVLKKDKKKEEKDEEISLEELIENEVRRDAVTHSAKRAGSICIGFVSLTVCTCVCSERLLEPTSHGSLWKPSWRGRRGKGRRGCDDLRLFQRLLI